MASNPIPDKLDDLFTLAEDMADGLNTHGVAIGVKQNTEAAVRATLAAAQTAQNTFDAARSLKTTRSTAVTVADSNAKSFLATARGVLIHYLGATWAQPWEETGFPNQSTAVPAKQIERQALLASLQIYFATHPAQENAPLFVTSANASNHFTALSDTRSALNQTLTDCGQKKAARDAAATALRKQARGLVDELGQLLGDEDPRWLAFGLNMPGSANTPDAPEGLVLAASGAGSINADWADTPRADRYHVSNQVVGVDANFMLAGSPIDSDFTLTGLPSGATVKVQVTAVNAAGESLPSAVKEIVVP